MEKKYIIELEDVSFNRHGNYADDGTELYRVKGFNALVFDRAGLDKLTPYTDPDTEVISEVAYEKGFAAGRDAAKETYSDGYKAGRQDEKYVSAESRNEAYQRGLNDAWKAAKKNYLPEDHGGLGYKTRMKVFGTDNIGWIFKNLSASEAIEKIHAFEKKKKEEQEIKVGDWVQNENVIGVVTYIEQTNDGICYHTLGEDGHLWYLNNTAIKKHEGRVPKEIAGFLKKVEVP